MRTAEPDVKAKKEVVALSQGELELEIKGIAACHAVLTNLSNHSRNRVINWLSSWANQETGDDRFW